LVSITTEEELLRYLAKRSSLDNTYFFLDYQLKGSKTSLRWISQFGINVRTALVTSYDYCEDLQTRCIELGLRLLSKRSIFQLPIDVIQPDPDFVFLDNDEFFIRLWKVASVEQKIEGLFFTHDLDLLRIASQLTRDTPIILDEELVGQRGSSVAEILNGYGFKSIYISSSHLSKKFESLTFLSGTLGKIPTQEIFEKLVYSKKYKL
jgi:hypothetical protein